MNTAEALRLEAKTPQHRLQWILEQEFHYAPRVAQAIVDEAQTCLGGSGGQFQPGQVRVILARQGEGSGQALPDTATTEVTWTVDAGAEDCQVAQAYGRTALRQVRLQRLVEEALAQGAVASQEDVARVLHVSLRTLKRDVAELEAAGVCLPTRGKVQGIGRGQTHKTLIIGRWLRGETYDQIMQHTHHCAASITRYIQTFVRVVQLHQDGFPGSQIAQLLEVSEPLVREYLAVYMQEDSPACRERLAAQLARLSSAARTVEKGAL